MSDLERPALWWVKRDFRVSDNAALVAAARHQSLIALLVLEPSIIKAKDASALHLHAQLDAAAKLQQTLRELGSELYLMAGELPDVFERVRSFINFSAIHAHQETGTQLTYERDDKVRAWCRINQIDYHEHTQNGVVRGSHKRVDRPAILATRLLRTAVHPAPLQLPTVPSGVENCRQLLRFNPELSHGLTQGSNAQSETFANNELCLQDVGEKLYAENTLQSLGEKQANTDLESFLNVRGQKYRGGISSPNLAFTHGSRLSAHLAWGTLSLRQVFAAKAERENDLHNSSSKNIGVTAWRKSLNAFQSRLFWHDHFVQRFEAAPQMEFEALNPAYQALAYLNDDEKLQRWLTGKTGIPLVDACIRCVQTCGFLNFRMRAMLVSVACYGLGQDWRRIQYPLAHWFFDYEPGIHFSQVQMQAGVVGINTIRVYNPHKQLLEHDADCKFVKKWIPELREFTAEEICNYQTSPLGDYPAPPDDFESTATQMKQRIFSIRNSDEGRKASAEILEAYGSRRPASSRRRVSRHQSTAITGRTQEAKVKATNRDVENPGQATQVTNDNVSELNPQLTLDF